MNTFARSAITHNPLYISEYMYFLYLRISFHSYGLTTLRCRVEHATTLIEMTLGESRRVYYFLVVAFEFALFELPESKMRTRQWAMDDTLKCKQLGYRRALSSSQGKELRFCITITSHYLRL
jgi:hypothetical protein